MLRIDAADGKSIDAAQAIDKSTEKIDLPHKKIKYSGGSTDSGGGGVLNSLKDELEKLDRINNPLDFKVAPCSIHGTQLILGNGIRHSMGEGGLEKRTCLQLLHTAYNLQKEFEDTELTAMWKKL